MLNINLHGIAMASMYLAVTYYILRENERNAQSHKRWMDVEEPENEAA